MSTLYQLKGRVGRGLRQAYAYFLTSNSTITTEAEQRLTYVKTFTALGSGYDLARRDMEMRGHGTVFGEEQSGAWDIGLDLQASMLSAAVEAIQQELIMCAPDTRVEVGDELEALGVRVGPLPAAADVNAISRWEARLTEEVVKELNGMAEVAAPVRKGAKKLPATIAEAPVEEAKPRRKAKIEPAQGTADAGADFCRRILSASSAAEITDIVTRFARIVNTVTPYPFAHAPLCSSNRPFLHRDANCAYRGPDCWSSWSAVIASAWLRADWASPSCTEGNSPSRAIVGEAVLSL
jgi:hypothetical protein